jgi:hypothetical protein
MSLEEWQHKFAGTTSECYERGKISVSIDSDGDLEIETVCNCNSYLGACGCGLNIYIPIQVIEALLKARKQ